MWNNLNKTEKWGVGAAALFSFIGLSTFFVFAFLHIWGYGVDFRAFQLGINALLADKDPYFVQVPPPTAVDIFPYLTRYLYPPISLLWLAPMALLQPLTAIICWTVAALLAFILILFSFIRRVPTNSEITPLLAHVMFLPWIFSYPLAHHLALGQCDIFVMALTVFFLWHHEDLPLLSGACLAIAILWKVYPSYFVVLVLVADPKRYMRSLIWAVIIGIPLLLLGFLAIRWEFWKSWFSVMSFKSRYGNTYIVNQSVVAMIQRLFDTRLGQTPALWSSIEVVKVAMQIAPVLAFIASVIFVRLIPAAYRSRPEILVAVFALFYPLGSSHWWIQQYIWLMPAISTMGILLMDRPIRSPACLVLLAVAPGILFSPWFDPENIELMRQFGNFIFYHRFLWAHLISVIVFICILIKLRRVQVKA